MRIDGEWYECDDGMIRPVLRGEVLTSIGRWEPAPFLVDTGADRTVLCAAIFDLLGLEPSSTDGLLGGVGGVARSVTVATRLRWPLSTVGLAQFRGEYAAFTELETLDMSVLGRDILDMFAVIIDRSANFVALVRGDHGYAITAK